MSRASTVYLSIKGWELQRHDISVSLWQVMMVEMDLAPCNTVVASESTPELSDAQITGLEILQAP